MGSHTRHFLGELGQGHWVSHLPLPRGTVAALGPAHLEEGVQEPGWKDFWLQDQHTGGETASPVARGWSGAAVREPACP